MQGRRNTSKACRGYDGLGFTYGKTMLLSEGTNGPILTEQC